MASVMVPSSKHPADLLNHDSDEEEEEEEEEEVVAHRAPFFFPLSAPTPQLLQQQQQQQQTHIETDHVRGRAHPSQQSLQPLQPQQQQHRTQPAHSQSQQPQSQQPQLHCYYSDRDSRNLYPTTTATEGFSFQAPTSLSQPSHSFQPSHPQQPSYPSHSPPIPTETSSSMQQCRLYVGAEEQEEFYGSGDIDSDSDDCPPGQGRELLPTDFPSTTTTTTTTSSSTLTLPLTTSTSTATPFALDMLPHTTTESTVNEPDIDHEEMRLIMLHKENSTPHPVFSADVAKYRAFLVEWMTQNSEYFGLLPLTVHIAINYLDTVLSRVTIHPSRFQLVAAVCLLMAAKHEEVDDNVPAMAQLNECCSNNFSVDIIQKMEVLLLNTLQWELMVVTPRHFLDLFAKIGSYAIDPTQDLVQNNRITPEKLPLVQAYLCKYSEFFLDMCVQDALFVPLYAPSVMAAASIAAARCQLRLEPVWPAHLVQITTYTFDNIRACLDDILQVYETSYLES
eukprot:TRINITY_DN815_c2_g3_i1.p1 TRINITY_DN815_c2_g3~~TRINITY_DN815_c2_g3_i1.p1  ORF type:complete len:506 (+),score=118.11 TRINITY_DN815_c2_g3_i1:753-2270(+)